MFQYQSASSLKKSVGVVELIGKTKSYGNLLLSSYTKVAEEPIKLPIIT